MTEQTTPLTDLRVALRMVTSLEKQARRSEDPEMKRILLTSGCDMIDRVLQQPSTPVVT